MLNCGERVIITRRHEWFVEAINGQIMIGDFYKIVNQAERKYEQIHGRQPSSDDWLKVRGSDTEVVISFETEVKDDS